MPKWSEERKAAARHARAAEIEASRRISARMKRERENRKAALDEQWRQLLSEDGQTAVVRRALFELLAECAIEHVDLWRASPSIKPFLAAVLSQELHDLLPDRLRRLIDRRFFALKESDDEEI